MTKKLLMLFLSMMMACYGYRAVVIVPVADLTVQKVVPPAGQTAADVYRAFPATWVTNKVECLREHQLRFNQIVEVLDQDGDQIFVRLPAVTIALREHDFGLEPLCMWMLKTAVLPFDTLSPEQQKLLPGATDSQTTQSTIALKYPWVNPQDKQCYSAGTRFVCTGKDVPAGVEVYWLDATTHLMHTIVLPETICYSAAHKTHKQRQLDMINLVNEWADNTKAPVNCVWGGVTVGMPMSGSVYATDNGWYWPGHDAPYYGVDSSGAILLAAQLVDLPYTYKNTTTIAAHMRALRVDEPLENGDVIWFPGHVTLVTDVDCGLCVELLGYAVKGGTLHRVALKERFPAITTSVDLVRAFHAHEQLERHYPDGSIRPQSAFKLLKFSSIYE